MYSTHPVKKIVGAFTIESIIEDDPRKLWERFKSLSGIEKEKFFEYFGNRKRGFAIKIKKVKELAPIEPKDLIPEFCPPQSFRYFRARIKLHELKKTKLLKEGIHFGP